MQTPPSQKNYHAQPSSNFCLCVAGTRIKEFLPPSLMLCVHPSPHDLPTVSPPGSPCLYPVGPSPHVLSHLLLHFCAEKHAPQPWEFLTQHCKRRMCSPAAQVRTAARRHRVRGERRMLLSMTFGLLSREQLRVPSKSCKEGLPGSQPGSWGTIPPTPP